MINENLDIIILTVIISLLFIIFILATVKEFAESIKKPFQGGKEKGIRADMINYIGSIFSDKSIEPSEKKELIDVMKKKLKELDDN